jgi:hypothetical protein
MHLPKTGTFEKGKCDRAHTNGTHKRRYKEIYSLVLGHGTLALEDLDENHGLVISSGREDLALLGGDSGTTLDEVGHDTASGLDTEGERVDIHEDNAVSGRVTSENTTLDGGTESDSLIGVDILADLLSEVLLKHSLNLGDTGRTTNKDDVVNVRLLQLGVLENLVNGLEGLLEEIAVQLLELGAGEGLGEVVALEERLNLDLGGLLGRESTLGLLNLALELRHGLGVLGDIDIVGLVVLLGEVADDTVIEILATKVSITSSRLDLENAILNGKNGDIESTTTKIVDKNLALLLVNLVKTVGESGGGGLVNDAENVKTGDSSGILSGSALSVVEVGRNGNNSVLDLLAEVGLSDLLHLAKNHSGDLFGGESLLLLVNLDGDVGLSALVDDLEGEVLDVILDGLVLELLTDKTLLQRLLVAEGVRIETCNLRRRRWCARGCWRTGSWRRHRPDARRR